MVEGDGDLRQDILDLLASRTVQLEEIVDLVHFLQKDRQPGLTKEDCRESILRVLSKREVQYALLVGIQLDRLAEKGLVDEPLLTILREDSPLFGIDEVLALAITNVYGSIGLTNFGYLDKQKIVVLARLQHEEQELRGQVHTFLDDLVAAVAAAAASRLAHRYGESQ
ncbi:MAG: phosphatidylglycerophosphatase A [Bacillota bacterium]|nr:phosphatidylglycerophosphatase A [Bacillota bacterium]